LAALLPLAVRDDLVTGMATAVVYTAVLRRIGLLVLLSMAIDGMGVDGGRKHVD